MLNEFANRSFGIFYAGIKDTTLVQNYRTGFVSVVFEMDRTGLPEVLGFWRKGPKKITLCPIILGEYGIST